MQSVDLGLKYHDKFFHSEAPSAIVSFKKFLEEKRSAEAALPKNILRKKVLVGCKNFGVLEGVKRLFLEYDISFLPLTSAEELSEVSNKTVGLVLFECEDPFEGANFLMFPDVAIFGEALISAKKRNEVSVKRLKINANRFEKGDLVVHKDYGVGLFEGLVTLEHGGQKYDAAKILYAAGDALYLPIYNVNLLSKFGGNAEMPAEEKLKMLDKLGGNGFKIRKAKTKQRLFAIADKLIRLAAERETRHGEIFAINTPLVEDFYSRFPHGLTADQALAIADVEADLSSGKIMDRLICGDVGFGKTEVAMRACFLACSGRLLGRKHGQCAVVVPTTILARQHFNNFTERFKGFRLKIRELSRNISPKERAATLSELAQGDVDILIGTHALFSEDVRFSALSLLVIDEEQHFGVKQKEKLKEGRENVHVLCLSATPIPRTLQISLAGLRDISVIATPPVERLLPRSFLIPYDKIVIVNAIMREKSRGGRVFFVCPRIADLEEQRAILQELMPEIRFCLAHGRMTATKLDDVMLDFYEGRADVLVTTSIIESGIDISFANTIIIYKAEMFGLSGLYQLRGRVGRSGTQSYAYFITDERNLVGNTPSKMRLRTLIGIKTLGSGFNIASSDMDIRGAGNLVGEEQSGQMNEVGVELYQEMLSDAVSKIRNSMGETHEDDDWVPEVKIGVPIMIPESYIADFGIRLEFYRRISAITHQDELMALMEEMADRFGEIPEMTRNLLTIVELKNMAKKAGVIRLDVGAKGMTAQIKEDEFAKFDEKRPERLIAYIAKNSKSMRLLPEGKLQFADDTQDLIKKARKALEIIAKI